MKQIEITDLSGLGKCFTIMNSSGPGLTACLFLKSPVTHVADLVIFLRVVHLPSL